MSWKPPNSTDDDSFKVSRTKFLDVQSDFPKLLFLNSKYVHHHLNIQKLEKGGSSSGLLSSGLHFLPQKTRGRNFLNGDDFQGILVVSMMPYIWLLISMFLPSICGISIFQISMWRTFPSFKICISLANVDRLELCFTNSSFLERSYGCGDREMPLMGSSSSINCS